MNPSNLTESMDKSSLYGYLAMYKNKKYEVWTDKGKYEAQKIAQAYFKAKKEYEIIIELCVRPNGKEVYQTVTN